MALLDGLEQFGVETVGTVYESGNRELGRRLLNENLILVYEMSALWERMWMAICWPIPKTQPMKTSLSS